MNNVPNPIPRPWRPPAVEEPDPAHDARCAALRARLIEAGQIVPGSGPKYMTVEQVQAWKSKLLKIKAWTPLLLRAVAKRTVQ